MWAAVAGLILILCLVVIVSLALTRILLGGFFKWMSRNGRQA